MQVKIFAMYDRVAHTYGEPFVAVKDELAVRRFNYIMSQSPMVAQDMQLFKLGEFDLETGLIVSSVEFVCNYDVKE